MRIHIKKLGWLLHINAYYHVVKGGVEGERTMAKPQLGKLLREARQKKGIPQRQAALEVARLEGDLSIDPTTISRYEHDKLVASLPRFVALCRIYDLPIARALRHIGVTDREIGIREGEMVDPLWSDIMAVIETSPAKRQLLEALVNQWMEDLGISRKRKKLVGIGA